MKKIYHLLACIAVAISVTGCNPLDKTYKELGDLPKPAASAVAGSVTLSAADYGVLPKGHAAKTSLYFKSIDTAKVDIPLILASKYPTYGDKSSFNVTYAITPTTIKLADSLNATTTLTLQLTPTSDYVYPAYNGNAGNTFPDFSATAAINYLNYKYQVPLPENSLRVMTYLYFESGKTASAGTLTTDAFLFQNGLWTKIYRVSNAQYASTGNGLNNWFVAADATNLPSYFNTFLKADPTVMLTAKAGDVKYVNYRYTTTYQRVLALTYDGSNWITTSTPSTLIFAKTNGVWVADNTVTYQLTAADHVTISGLTFGSDLARANLASFKSVDLRSTSTTKWLPEEIANAVAALAKIKFGATAEQNQIFNLSYYGYTGTYAYVVVKLKYVGTDFVIQP
jgi:hypothetical protein